MASTKLSMPKRLQWVGSAAKTVSFALKWLYNISLVAGAARRNKVESLSIVRRKEISQAKDVPRKPTTKTQPRLIPRTQQQALMRSYAPSLYSTGSSSLCQLELEMMMEMDGLDFLLESHQHALAKQELVKRRWEREGGWEEAVTESLV